MNKTQNLNDLGFTLIEVLTVIIVLGILAAIAAPSWLGFVNTRRLTAAQDQVYRTMREAQSNAKRDKINWQASFRENNGIVQWALHPADSTQFIPSNVKWNDSDKNIQVYKGTNARTVCETTLKQQVAPPCPAVSPWRVQFDYKGGVTELGQITLISKNGGTAQRCVYVSTLLGAMRTGKENSRPSSENKYCY